MRANIRCEKRVNFCVYDAEGRRVARLVNVSYRLLGRRSRKRWRKRHDEKRWVLEKGGNVQEEMGRIKKR